MNSHEWDDNEIPLAYLITIRTFGTWLHGDKRGSVDRHGKNGYGSPKIAGNPKLHSQMRRDQASPEFLLDGPQRSCVERAVNSMCRERGYGLFAINVRTNHAHTVISAAVKPEIIISAIKSNATRELRVSGLVDTCVQVWSRGGSRRYLCKQNQVEAAVDYVNFGQGRELPNF